MKRIVAFSMALTLGCSLAYAQPGQHGQRPGRGFQQRSGGGGPGGGPGGASRPGSSGSSTLENAGLKIGQPLPDLTIFDELGKPFPLAGVKGKHTVIVFGCLT